MWDLLIIGIMTLLSIILGIDSFTKWRASKKAGFLVGSVLSIAAAVVFVIDLTAGFSILFLAMVVRIIVGLRSRTS